MLVFVALIAVWGVIGYFAIESLVSRIKMKRDTNQMVAYWNKQAELQRNYNKAMYNVIKSAEEN